MTPFDGSGKEAFLKTLWEKEKLPTMFSTLSKTEITIFVTFNLSSANAFNLVGAKILSCGNGLINVRLSWSDEDCIFDVIFGLVVLNLLISVLLK